MPASTYARGDYFSEAGYLRPNAEAGVVRDRAGTAMVVLPEVLFELISATLETELGPVASQAIRETGRAWGRDFATRFDRDLAQYYGAPVSDWSFARFEAAIVSGLAHLGWGRAALDPSRFDQGTLVVTVRQPAAGAAGDAFLAGALAGMFSTFTGQNLDALATGRTGDETTFVLSLSERIARVSSNGSLRDVIEGLAATSA